jgi:hypothetical protein
LPTYRERDYASEYLSLVYDVQRASSVYNIVEWVHLNYADALYAKVDIYDGDEGGGFVVNRGIDHRKDVNTYVALYLATKKIALPELIAKIKENIALNAGGPSSSSDEQVAGKRKM